LRPSLAERNRHSAPVSASQLHSSPFYLRPASMGVSGRPAGPLLAQTKHCAAAAVPAQQLSACELSSHGATQLHQAAATSCHDSLLWRLSSLTRTQQAAAAVSGGAAARQCSAQTLNPCLCSVLSPACRSVVTLSVVQQTARETT
jgi:hypothetical protein